MRAAIDGSPRQLAQRRHINSIMGSRALQPQGELPSRASPGVIQRKTGFEYELDVPVMKGEGFIPEGAPDEQDDTYEYVTKAGADTKETIADRGYEQGLFKVVTDHGAITAAVQDFQRLFVNDQHVGAKVKEQLAKEDQEPAKLEYVTAALDESDANYAAMYSLQLRTVVESIKGVIAQDPSNDTFDIGAYTIGVPADLQPPIVNGKQQTEGWGGLVAKLRSAVNFNAYMQATAGIDITKVPSLVHHEVPQHLVAHRVHRKILAPLSGYVGRVIGSLPQCSTRAEYDAVRGFVTLVVQYLVSYAYWKTEENPGGTSKNLAPFWIKANLSQVRTQLPNGAADYVKRYKQDVFNGLGKINIDINKDVQSQNQARTVPDDEQPFSVSNVIPGTEESQFIFAVILEEYDKISEKPTIGAYEQRGAVVIPLEFRSIEAHPAAAELVRESVRIVDAVRALHGQAIADASQLDLISLSIDKVALEMGLTPKVFLDTLWTAAVARSVNIAQLFSACVEPATQSGARNIVREYVAK